MLYSKKRAFFIIWNGPEYSIAVTAKSSDYHCQLNIIIPMIINTPHNWIQLFLKLPIITLSSPLIASERHNLFANNIPTCISITITIVIRHHVWKKTVICCNLLSGSGWESTLFVGNQMIGVLSVLLISLKINPYKTINKHRRWNPRNLSFIDCCF